MIFDRFFKVAILGLWLASIAAAVVLILGSTATRYQISGTFPAAYVLDTRSGDIRYYVHGKQQLQVQKGDVSATKLLGAMKDAGFTEEEIVSWAKGKTAGNQ